VPSTPAERVLLTIGNALRPLEFAIVENQKYRIEKIVEEGHLRGHWRDMAKDFCSTAGDKMLVGVYRTSSYVPPQIFYAHKEHAQEAAIIAIADSILQSHRGFPMLIDLADSVCHSIFGVEGFRSTIKEAYARRGSALEYFNERETRG
jgi:hypothetical protein